MRACEKLQILAKNSGMKTLAGSQILAAAGSPGLPPFLQDESRSCLNLRRADTRDSRECPSLLSCSGGRSPIPPYRFSRPRLPGTRACTMRHLSSCRLQTCRTLSSLRPIAWRSAGFSISANLTPPRACRSYATAWLSTPTRALADARWPCFARRIAQPHPPRRMAFQGACMLAPQGSFLP